MSEQYVPLYSRRGFERFPLTGRATVTSGLARGISSLVADISSRGASIVTTVPFEKNELLEVALDPCSLYPSRILRHARVVWCTRVQADLWQAGLDFGMGNLIRFS
jgi:hypothetical protein